MNVEDFLSRLNSVRRSGSGWTAKCPAHDDGRASLSVGEGEDGRILVKCFASCEVEAVVGAMGLQMSDFMPKRPEKRSRRRIATTYDYKAADGTVLFQVVRYEPKDFRQRRPDGKGGWTWSLDGVKPVPYRLPELLAAEPSCLVFVVEGEKDADRLARLGLVATTSPGGAGNWRSEFAEFLRGHRVVVLPDNDGSGAEHAEDVARSLSGVAASLRVVHLPNLPNKGDVSDWLEAGGTAEELKRLAQEAPEWTAPPVESGATLLDSAVQFVRRFVFMFEAQAVVIALWIVHTWAIAAAYTTAYLHITSPERRCGKTLLLELLELLAARPWLTGRMTAAVLVRKVDTESPTLLLDESDTAFSAEKEYAEALRGILNTGYRRSGKASLCVGQGAQMSYRDFSTFSPKAIAGIGRLPDTVADRSIPIRLKRKTRGDTVERFGPRKKKAVAPFADALRSNIERWATASVERLTDAEPELPEELNDRAQDGTEPLLAIADLAGDEWPRRARAALVELCKGEAAEDESLGVRLLDDCRSVFTAQGVDRLSSADLCAALVGMVESPWAELQKGRQLTQNKLARLLRPFGIGSGSIRLDDRKTPKGYYRASFEDAWTRYLPVQEESSETDARPISGFQTATPPQVNTGAGFLDLSNRHTEDLVADEKRDFVSTGLDCGVVAVQEPSPERIGEPESEEMLL